MIKFSIIIPVYNVEKYIDKCLSSIYSQSFDESKYEVIVINDGSQDQSMSIAYDFARKHSNLCILEKKNEGVSSARNVGIRQAIGEYLTFVDADDWIEPNSLYKAYEYLTNTEQLDVLMFKSTKMNGIERYSWDKLIKNGTICSGVDAYKNGYKRGSVCGGFYKKSFLQDNKIEFPIGVRNGEDSIVMSLILTYAQRICFAPIPFYIVFERPGSASRLFTEKHLNIMNETLKTTWQIHQERLNTNITIQQSCILTDMLYQKISLLTHMSIALGNISLRTIKKNIPIKSYLPIQYEHNRKISFKQQILNHSYSGYYWAVWFIIKIRNIVQYLNAH